MLCADTHHEPIHTSESIDSDQACLSNKARYPAIRACGFVRREVLVSNCKNQVPKTTYSERSVHKGLTETKENHYGHVCCEETLHPLRSVAVLAAQDQCHTFHV